MNFYVTFGQLHPLRNGYVVVIASDYEQARKVTFEVLGNKWSSLNDESSLEGYKHMYPAGQFGLPIIGE